MKALFERHARYNRWMNRRLYALMQTMPDAERRADRGAFFGSVHGTLNHLLLGDRLWITHWAQQGFIAALPESLSLPDVDALDQPLYPGFGAMVVDRECVDDLLVQATEAWNDELLHRESVERWPDGRELRRPLWVEVQHLFNHQTHHRGQLSTLLTQAGLDIGVTDIVALPRES